MRERHRERQREKNGREMNSSCLRRMTKNKREILKARKQEREKERHSYVFTSTGVVLFAFLLLSLCFSLSHERMSCAAWQRATPSSYMMQQHTHEQDKAHTSPSRMHRAGYRHAAPASVYTHSLIGMPQHACTIHICIHQKKAHTRTHAQTHHTCIHTSVCIMYARE